MLAIASPTTETDDMPILSPFLDGTLFLMLVVYGLGYLDPLEFWAWGLAHKEEFRFALTLLGLLGMGWRYSQFGSRAWRRFKKWRAAQALPPAEEEKPE